MPSLYEVSCQDHNISGKHQKHLFNGETLLFSLCLSVCSVNKYNIVCDTVYSDTA